MWKKVFFFSKCQVEIVRRLKLQGKRTSPANASVAFDGLKQQHLGTDSHIKILQSHNLKISSVDQHLQYIFEQITLKFLLTSGVWRVR